MPATENPPTMTRRWPRAVFDTGEEPDPRFTLANERTFLAWIRTTLALLACSTALEALDLPMERRVQGALAVVLALTALASALQAYRGWARTERALRHRLPLPSAPVNLVVVVGTVIACIALVASSVTNGSR